MNRRGSVMKVVVTSPVTIKCCLGSLFALYVIIKDPVDNVNNHLLKDILL